MHEYLARGPDAGPGPPRVFIRGNRFGERDQLIGNVAPFAIEPLPQAIERIDLRIRTERAENQEQQNLHAINHRASGAA